MRCEKILWTRRISSSPRYNEIFTTGKAGQYVFYIDLLIAIEVPIDGDRQRVVDSLVIALECGPNDFAGSSQTWPKSIRV